MNNTLIITKTRRQNKPFRRLKDQTSNLSLNLRRKAIIDKIKFLKRKIKQNVNTKEYFSMLQSTLSKSVNKGIIHINKASRILSRFAIQNEQKNAF